MKQVFTIFSLALIWSCKTGNSNSDMHIQDEDTTQIINAVSDANTRIQTKEDALRDSLQNTQILPRPIRDTPSEKKISTPKPIKKETKKETKNFSEHNLPKCVQALIVKFLEEEKQNPPRKIIRYQYKNKTVYYVPAICCDQYSDLYDAQCNLMGHPDGGFTGKGDGKFTDFEKNATNEKVVWNDKR